MIPVKLTLENFKAYRKGVPTLHLAGVHIACLSGSNGHGKTSLLDAMAWALWGSAVHNRQEELVHIGEQDMRVELEFVAGGRSTSPTSSRLSTSGRSSAQGQLYRVIRRFTRGSGARAGATSLELQVAVGDSPSMNSELDPSAGLTSPRLSTSDRSSEQGFRSISGNSVRETEATVRKLVGMDYDTFVNSAFLVQGHADEFTTKRPAERQRVLGEILGLGYYERLQDRARQKARERADEIRQAQGQVQAWEQELVSRHEYEKELPSTKEELDRVAVEIGTVEGEENRLREQVESLRGRQREMEEVGRQRNAAREELRQLQAQVATHDQRVKAWEAVIARREKVQLGFVRLTALRQRDEEMGRLLEPHARLQERKRPLVNQAESLDSLEASLTEEKQRLAQAEERNSALEAQRTELQDMEVQRQSIEAENQRLRTEMDNFRGKIDMLKEGDVRCPLCGTDLGDEGKEHISAEYEAQGKSLAERYRLNSATLQSLEPRRKELSAIVEKETREGEEVNRQVHGRIATLSQQAEEARKAPDVLREIEAQLEQLGYDPTAHQGVKTEIQGLAPVEEEHRTLQQADLGLPTERESLQRATTLANGRQEAMAQAEKRVSATQRELESLGELEQRLGEVEARRRDLQGKQRELVGRHGFLESRLKELASTESRKGEAEKSLQKLADDRDVFEQLGTAFGRTGVQALLVEAAIPELEVEANRLLGRMTENTMNVKLETQRESQRGEAVETLEIKVSDALGTRSYETFSGGEAFRINLALRIALSKLLAHRAGAPLPTLFIDEGFGTQDAAGRERVLDVIQSIAEDFERILVITHMDEVKDAFPVRIEVQKTPEGSTFTLT